MNDNQKTTVIFRKFKKGNNLPEIFIGDILAIFPYITTDTIGAMCGCYDRIHSECEYNYILTITELANPAEYKEMQKKLEDDGYDLDIKKIRNYKKWRESVDEVQAIMRKHKKKCKTVAMNPDLQKLWEGKDAIKEDVGKIIAKAKTLLSFEDDEPMNGDEIEAVTRVIGVIVSVHEGDISAKEVHGELLKITGKEVEAIPGSYCIKLVDGKYYCGNCGILITKLERRFVAKINEYATYDENEEDLEWHQDKDYLPDAMKNMEDDMLCGNIRCRERLGGWDARIAMEVMSANKE